MAFHEIKIKLEDLNFRPFYFVFIRDIIDQCINSRIVVKVRR